MRPVSGQNERAAAHPDLPPLTQASCRLSQEVKHRRDVNVVMQLLRPRPRYPAGAQGSCPGNSAIARSSACAVTATLILLDLADGCPQPAAIPAAVPGVAPCRVCGGSSPWLVRG